MLGFWLIISFMVLGNVGWWWWADRRIRRLPAAGVWRTAVGVFVGAQLAYLLFFFIAPSIARRSHEVIPAPILGVFYLWSLIVLPATVLVILLKTGGAKAVQLMSRVPKDVGASTAIPESQHQSQPTGAGQLTSLSRRHFLAAAAVAIPPLATVAGVAYGRRSVYDLRVRRVDLPIAGLPADLNGLTIAHITDVHVGKFVDDRYLRRVRETANELRADLHLLTGDLIDLSLADLPVALDFVTALDPRHGLMMCEGNHDLIDDGSKFYAGTKARGVPVLRDQTATMRLPGRSTPIRLIGLPWSPANTAAPGAPGFDDAVRDLQAQASPGGSPLEVSTIADGGFSILLAHHPHAFDAAAAAGIPLTLAGHTHGGLLMLSEKIGPASVLYRYWSGLYRKGPSNLFVSNGVGSWFPVRVNAQPEIVHLTLRQA